MAIKILLSIAILIYAFAVPVQEIGSHVFNANWPPHARLHELWQLLSNSSIGLFSLWLLWVKNDVRLSSLLGLLVSGGFLLAYSLRGFYEGSMSNPPAVENMLMGLNVSVLSFAIIFAIFLLGLITSRPRAGAVE